MKQEHTFTLTERALKAVAGKGSLNFEVAADSPDPLPGDLFSTEEMMPHVLIIKRRHFHFVTPDHLQIDYLLDLNI